ncbi:MAG: hypothetical protein KGI37_00260 [Alphaproteobacteria bacterium]|nr:hypothetical protein [Alphaproteobacteria bacterium]
MDKAIFTPAVRFLEKVSGVGFFLVIASVIYFIIGSVVGLVHGDMLAWTFCGSVHHIFGPDWCGYAPHTPWAWGDLFVHRFINAALPWVMIVLGLVLLAVTLPLMNALGYKYQRPNNQD